MKKVSDGLPEAFIDKLQTIIARDEYHQVLKSFSQVKPTTLRVNTLKITPEELVQRIQNKGVLLQSVSWNPIAYIVLRPTLRELTELSEYKDGLFYVQSLSSMIPPIVLDPKPGERILDIAAAPGSKTTQIAALMQNKGLIVANDTSHIRRYRLEANMQIQGVSIAQISKLDARGIWQEYPEYFDKTLVDVPCSMEGRFLTSNQKTYKDWSQKKVKMLSQLQRWILRSAISATKPGGIIVYSTCTLSPEENEDVISWALEKENDAISLESISIDGLSSEPGVRTWGTKKYNESISHTMRIYPSDTMEGFFIAKIRKLRSSVPTALQE